MRVEKKSEKRRSASREGVRVEKEGRRVEEECLEEKQCE